MTAIVTPETVVLSELLSDLPKATKGLAAVAGGSLIDSTVSPVRKPLPVDVAYADTLDAGHTEGLNEWAWRVLGEAP